MESLLRSALTSVPAPESSAGWEENVRRVRRDTRRRTAVAAATIVGVATAGVLGFTYVHEPGRGEPLPVQPLGTQEPTR